LLEKTNKRVICRELVIYLTQKDFWKIFSVPNKTKKNGQAEKFWLGTVRKKYIRALPIGQDKIC
jgi:hypothetical protein